MELCSCACVHRSVKENLLTLSLAVESKTSVQSQSQDAKSSRSLHVTHDHQMQTDAADSRGLYQTD